MSSHAFDAHSTIGAMSIGSLVSMFLFGMVTLQTHNYFHMYRDDKAYLKALVTVLWILELAHTFCISAEVYRDTIVNYGRPETLIDLPWLSIAIFLTGGVTFLANGFLSSRVWIVLPTPWRGIGPVCFLVTLVQLVAYFAAGALGVITKNLPVYNQKYGWLVRAILISGTVVDLSLAFSLVYYLRSQRDQLLPRSMRRIDLLVQYTICTGLLTSAAAMALLITFTVKPSSLAWVAIFTCRAKLYSNCVMASGYLRSIDTNPSSNFIPSIWSTARTPGGGANSGSRSGSEPVFQVSVEMSAMGQELEEGSFAVRIYVAVAVVFE
ncbi:hypothetical protein CC1G_12454 [Coprinopsis cinerea okayama7|uniref:DUF6534 domain-containing protein n=1 Tax=Coprinopsis cinerea (strain Okayama-7 / 130 / ATCC MYA-4618 / FGSC 9003) TaxID=240176 RepID=A8NKZ0_COPC7|nr:hypothetical protein CC1G_12454 [Coprinopsis cinerea okayama7\|eukprot:XP_001834576.2 hypothetical protein CC1G_12454 [Coprinopsis cinerea okayama7\